MSWGATTVVLRVSKSHSLLVCVLRITQTNSLRYTCSDRLNYPAVIVIDFSVFMNEGAIMRPLRRSCWLLLLLSTVLAFRAYSQGTEADYERANSLRTKYETAAIDITGQASWIGNTHQFWYRKLTKGINEYIIDDADTLQKRSAFDSVKIAASLSKLTGNTYKPSDLNLTALRFDSSGASFSAGIDGLAVRCTVADAVCARTEPPVFGRRNQGPVLSPNGKWEALINNYNLAVRAVGSRELTFLSTDGSEGNYYEPRSIAWSPDSSRLAVFRVRPGYKREVHYIESSPEDQIQPKSSSIVYAKPGDVLDLEQPVLFDVIGRKQINVDNSLFPNLFELTDPTWRKDSRAFFFEYNQRGHQVYRVIEVDAASGKARALISDE